MNPYWFRPEHQPSEGEPVEFEIRPLDMRAAYAAWSTLENSGAIATDACLAIFARNVVGWRGISEPCTPQARQQVVSASGPVYGHELGDWLIWIAMIGRSAYRHSTLTDAERKNS